MTISKVLGVCAVSFAMLGCTSADQKTAQQVTSGVAVVASVLAPLVCTSITLAGQQTAGSVCGAVASDVGDVAQLVSKIISSLPPSPAGRVDPTVVNGLAYRGVTIVLPPGIDPGRVQQALARQATH